MAKKKDEISEAVADEKTTQQDQPETTPEPEPTETEDTEVKLSSKEHEDLIKQAKAAVGLGRTLKTALEANTVMQRNYDSQGKRLAEMDKTMQSIRAKERERELDAAQGTPAVLDVIRLKHQTEDDRETFSKERSAFEAEKTQYLTKLEKLAKDEATELAKDLAKSTAVSATLLLQIATDTAEDGKVSYNLERMKQIAKSNPKQAGEEEEEEEEGPSEEKETTKGQRALAAGARSGGARGYRTAEDYDRALISGEISQEQYREGMKRLNVNI